MTEALRHVFRRKFVVTFFMTLFNIFVHNIPMVTIGSVSRMGDHYEFLSPQW